MATEIHALSDKLEERERQPPGQAKQRKHFKNKMHLWEFLLELLHDEECRPLITWTKKDRKEFKITQPECVAQLWGLEHNRKNMTYDKLSRALRQYYEKGIVTKVKGQKSAFKFDKLPYEYNPGVTRRRRTGKISTCPTRGMVRGINSFLTRLNSNGADGRMPPYALRSSQLTSLQHKAQIWFPEKARPSHNKFERRRVNSWGTFESATLESRNPSLPLFAQERSAFGNVTPSLMTHSKSQSYHTSSDLMVARQNILQEVSSSFVCANPEQSTKATYPLNVVKQNASRNDRPSAATCTETLASFRPESSHSRFPSYVVEKNASRNCTPSASIHTDAFASVTPESSHLRSPLYGCVVEKNASRNRLPSDLAYASMYVTDSVPWPTPVFLPVHRIPYLPLTYVVPVPYEHLPVITSVTGNYSGHPGQD